MDAASVFDVPDSRMECYRQYVDLLKREQRLFLDNDNPPEDEDDLPVRKEWWFSIQIEFLEQLLEQIPLAKRFYKDFGSSMNAEEQVIITVDTPSPRYLCILSACTIWCLDLKQSKSGSLVKLGELEVKANGLPVSAGLFNWESDAYMICGCPDANPLPAETDSNDFYGLSSLAPDGTLSLSRSNRFRTLNKPKRFPVVEQIDGQIHVIDSACPYAGPCHGQVFSHEVLYPGAKSWDQISPPITEKEWSCITSHLVVGNDIYAISGCFSDRIHVRFHNATKEWEARPTTKSPEGDPFSVKNVWNILELGMARCIGKYPGATELYVLVAVAKNWKGPYGDYNGMVAVAYLVTGEGSVVCIHHLPHFFSLDPSRMVSGTIVNVDAEGKTLCAIVEGYSLELPGRQLFLYISTFSVEILTDKDRLVVEGGDCLPCEEELVRVAVKEKYVYTKSESRFERHWPFQACFLQD